MEKAIGPIAVIGVLYWLAMAGAVAMAIGVVMYIICGIVWILLIGWFLRKVWEGVNTPQHLAVVLGAIFGGLTLAGLTYLIGKHFAWPARSYLWVDHKGDTGNPIGFTFLGCIAVFCLLLWLLRYENRMLWFVAGLSLVLVAPICSFLGTTIAVGSTDKAYAEAVCTVSDKAVHTVQYILKSSNKRAQVAELEYGIDMPNHQSEGWLKPADLPWSVTKQYSASDDQCYSMGFQLYSKDIAGSSSEFNRAWTGSLTCSVVVDGVVKDTQTVTYDGSYGEGYCSG